MHFGLHFPTSKLLCCISVVYLIAAVSLTLYAHNHSGAGAPPPESLLFTYPPTYGERKHVLPAVPTCNTPLLFSEYRVAYDEIHALCSNSSSPSKISILRYANDGNHVHEKSNGVTFAGNFSTQTRKSFFDLHRLKDRQVVPCGFLNNIQFRVRPSDKMAMDDCRGVVVASAIFGDYDKIRQPRGVRPETLETVCFFVFVDELTLNVLNSHGIVVDRDRNKIGAWRIAVVENPLPYGKNNGVIPKHLVHRLFPNAKFSVWIDAKLQLVVDPLLLLHSLLLLPKIDQGSVDMAISKHPFNVHTMEEAVATARWKKWRDVDALRLQMETYCQNGLLPWSPDKLPYTTDVPDTAMIVRRHGARSNLFSCLLFNELEAFNPRDQLAFAYVRDLMNPRIRIHMFEVETFQQISLEYRHNINIPHRSDDTAKRRSSRRASPRSINGSSCQHYLSKMWLQQKKSI